MEILEDLYYGNIAPFERTVRRSKEYNKLMELLVRHEETLNAGLTDEQKEILKKYRDCQSELSGISEVDAFITGFELGVKLMLEVTGDEAGYGAE